MSEEKPQKEAPAPEAPAPEKKPHKVEPPQEEKLIWEGVPKWQADFGILLVWGIVAVLGVVLMIWRPISLPWFIGFAVLLLGGVMIGAIRIKRMRQHYKLTNLIVEFQEGVFSTHIDNMELWRINDIGYHRNLFDMMLKVSRIRLHTQDKSHPVLDLVGLPPGRDVYDEIKEGVHIARQARNVLGMTE